MLASVVGTGYGALRASGAWDKIAKALGITADVWAMKVCDEDQAKASTFKDLVIVSQTPPEDMTWNITLRSGRKVTLGDHCPPVIPTGGDPDSVTFRAMFTASSALDDLTSVEDALVSFCRKDETLGRRPVVIWSYGKHTLRALLDGTITIGYPYGHWELTGNPRAISFTMSLVKSVQYGLDYQTEKEKESIYHTLMAGETPELVAWRYLGDPLLGVKIRQTNTDFNPEPVSGDRLKVLETTHSKMQGAVRPRSPAFGSAAAQKRFEELFDLRMGENGIAYEDWPTEML